MIVHKRLRLVIIISFAAALIFISSVAFNRELPQLLRGTGNYLERSSEYFPGQWAPAELLHAFSPGKRSGDSMATITVSTSAQLTTALSSAHGGDTILLAAGTYGDVALANLSFASQVTIQSADPTHPAEFRTISVSGSQGLTFENLNVHFTPDATTVSFNSAIKVSDSSNITFVHNEIVGGPAINGVPETATTLDSTQNVIGWPAARAMTLSNSSNVQVLDNDINTFDRGIVLQHVTNVNIENNDIHDLRRTPIDGGDVSQTVIKDNYLHDLKPWHWGSGDHADFIHIWTVPTSQTAASAGLVIQGNYLAQGNGTAVLGIYLDDNSNGIGFTNTQISGNVIYNGNAQGLRLENVVNSSVDGNLLLQSSGELKIGPGILVRDNATGLAITNNILSGLDLSHLTGTNGNILVQSISSTLANFSGIVEGTSLTWLEAMQIRQHLTGQTSTSTAPGSDVGIDLSITTSTTGTTSGTTSGTSSGGTTTGTTAGGTTTSSGGDTTGSTTTKGSGHGSMKGHAVQIARVAETSSTTTTTKTVAAMTEKDAVTTASTSSTHVVEWSSSWTSKTAGLHSSLDATFGLSHAANATLPLASDAPTVLQHTIDLVALHHEFMGSPHHDYLV